MFLGLTCSFTNSKTNNMIRFGFLIAIVFLLETSYAQTSTDNGKPCGIQNSYIYDPAHFEDIELFNKNIGNIKIYFIAKSDKENQKTIWDLYLSRNPNEPPLLLESETVNGVYNPCQQPITGDIRKLKIIGGAYFIDDRLYVPTYRFGKVTLKIFEFNSDYAFSKREYFLTNRFLGSYANFGDPKFAAVMKKITKNEIFISTDKREELFSFDISSGNVYEYRFDSNKEFVKVNLELKPDSTDLEAVETALNSAPLKPSYERLFESQVNVLDVFFDWEALANYQRYGSFDMGWVYVISDEGKPKRVVRYSLFKKSWEITVPKTKQVLENEIQETQN